MKAKEFVCVSEKELKELFVAIESYQDISFIRRQFNFMLNTEQKLEPLISDAFDAGEQSGMDSEFGRNTTNDKKEYLTKEI